MRPVLFWCLNLFKVAKYEIQKPSTCRVTLVRYKFWSMFRVFHLAWSTWPATTTFVAGWINAVRWLVDLLGTSKFVARQVVSLMKNEQQSQNLLLKVDPRSTFRNNFLQPATNVFVARQADHAKMGNIDKTCNETMLRDKLRVFVSRISPPLILNKIV